ncbi:MAG TPA: SGNH/GDSL hydrolase family protein, partial [Gemmatales bacterium]|nr:SGNH/GDSL hydrolase family protein [Gemmatales bacterium]
QEREWLEEFGWPLQPDALLVVFCRNDVSPSQRQKSDVHRSSAGRLGQWLTERSLLAFKLERGLARLRAAALGREGQKSLVVAAAAELEGLPFVEQAYRQLAASARERGVPVTLLIVPTLDLLTGKEADDLSPRLTALGDELGWRVIDLEPALLPADPAWFLPDDPVHPSAAGYARLADWLAPRIQADLAAR